MKTFAQHTHVRQILVRQILARQTLMKGLAIGLLTASLLCRTTQANETATLPKPVVHGEMQTLIQRYVQDDTFQGVVLVSQRGQILHHAAYGMADVAQAQPNQLDTRFLIGSLTKSFTAIAVLQLAEAGKLDLHAPISRYLPKLRKDLAERLTLHQLLKHQSGLPVHLERLSDRIDTEHPATAADILAIINTATLAFAPGSRYEYGNLGYHLAALVVEQVTGKPYADVLREQIFLPAGMSATGIERQGQRPPHRANGYAKELLGLEHDENNVSWAFGTGDIYSTTADLQRWDSALFGNGLLSANSKAQLFAGENAERGNYGYGFRIQPYQRAANQPDGRLIRHGGSMDGFLSNYHRYAEDELTVIVLGNIRPFDIRQLTFELKEVALGTASLQRKRGAE